MWASGQKKKIICASPAHRSTWLVGLRATVLRSALLHLPGNMQDVPQRLRDLQRGISRGTRMLYFSRQCACAYVVMIVINVGLVFWTLSAPGGYGGSTFFLIQLVANLILVGEVLMRYGASPEAFWDDWTNTFDMFVVIMAIATQFLYLWDADDFEVAEDGALIFRILRDGLHFLRLGVFVKNRTKSNPYKVVSFEEVDDFGSLPVRYSNDPLLDEGVTEEYSEDGLGTCGKSDFIILVRGGRGVFRSGESISQQPLNCAQFVKFAFGAGGGGGGDDSTRRGRFLMAF